MKNDLQNLNQSLQEEQALNQLALTISALICGVAIFCPYFVVIA